MPARIELGRRAVRRWRSPQDAQALGIATIYQELNLLPNLTVAENVFIGREPGGRAFLSWRRLVAQTREVLERIGLAIDPLALVRDLSVAEQQMVEIARALSMDSRLIIMDEPTSALSEAEVERLFAIVRELRDQGLGIIFVTHRLDEVMRICDRATVLRDGRLVGTRAIGELVGRRADPDDGRPLGVASCSRRWRRARPDRSCSRCAACRGAAMPLDPHASVLDDVSFAVRARRDPRASPA